MQIEIERAGALASSETREPSTVRLKRPVKYRDGENEWSGCGSMPAWAKLKGDALESYRI